MDNIKREQVYNVLMMPIVCTEHSKGIPAIQQVGRVIETTQTYYPYKKWSLPKDEDMSDFACGFYEILYKDVLNGMKIVNENDAFTNRQFAGDTMTSKGHLPELAGKYHCLSNFWLIPMNIGRTSNHTPPDLLKWSKTSPDYNIQDFMDRFLLLLKYNFEEYVKNYSDYFKNIKTFNAFVDVHFLRGSFVSQDYDVVEFSQRVDSNTANIAYEMIQTRAAAISKSKYCQELWSYFNEYGLI